MHARFPPRAGTRRRTIHMLNVETGVVQMGGRDMRRTGTVMLIAAAVLIGIAIVMDSDLGRVVNGVGGVLWFASAGVLTVSGVRTDVPGWLWLVLFAVTVVVAFFVTPSAVVPALVGFVPAGFLMAAIAPRRKLLFAALVPAWYLPMHIGTAVIQSVVRAALGHEASIRTDPPPTA